MELLVNSKYKLRNNFFFLFSNLYYELTSNSNSQHQKYKLIVKGQANSSNSSFQVLSCYKLQNIFEDYKAMPVGIVQLRGKLEKSNNVWQSNDEIEGGLDFNNGSYL